MKEDYYDILGVDRNASTQDIKRAYRKKAIEYHPDKNPGDAEAEVRFKKAAEAYEILSNPDKRAQYDRFGHQAFEGGGGFGGGMRMEDIFAQFGDIFGDAFGGRGFSGFSGFGGGHQQQLVKGSNLRIRVGLTLEEVANGVEKKLKVRRKKRASGVTYKNCDNCGGAGQVTRIANTILGRMQTSAPCRACSGTGQVIDHKPSGADANGMILEEEVIPVKIPPGVVDGMQLKVNGKGNEAPAANGIPGDLIVLIAEKVHPTLQRDDTNLHYDLYISFSEAVLGTVKEVDTVSGKARIKVEPGVQSGKVLRLRGKGIPGLNGHSHGDLLVHVNVWTPKSLSREQKDFFERMSEDPNFQPSPKRGDKSFFEKVKDMFS